MPLQLRDNLSFCVCGGRIIFLDLEADRYFCLEPALETVFRRWAAMPAGADGDKDLSQLCARRILVATNGAQPAPRTAITSPATRDLSTACTPRLRDVAQALAAELAAAAWLRTRPLTKILPQRGGLIPGRKLTLEERELRAAQLAAAFGRSALILGSSDRCLARALAAMSLCRRRRLAATLVFGVRVNPFAAHSWVQLDDTVLVGDFDQSRLFTPILFVR